MSWKLVFGLSLLGLAVTLVTALANPLSFEPHLWCVVFVIASFAIAKGARGRYFLHGLLVSVMGSLWMTAAHFVLRDSLVAAHARAFSKLGHLGSTELIIATLGPAFGVAVGIVLGFVAWGTSKFVVSRHSEFAGW